MTDASNAQKRRERDDPRLIRIGARPFKAGEALGYFFQGAFFGAFTGLKSLPPGAMPSPRHFLHQTPFS